MATEFRLPELGENVKAAQVVKVLVSAGDRITPDQYVLELETDKAVVELPASLSGTVTQIHVKEGQEIQVGQIILTLETAGTEQPAAVPAAATPEPAPAARVEPAPPAAAPPKVEAPPAPGDGQPAALAPAAAQPVPATAPVPAAPSVRMLARELGVDIDRVPGSGPGGRISAEDVKGYVRGLNLAGERAAPAEAAPTPLAAPPLPDFTRWGEVVREPMSSIRRTTARRLSQAWVGIPHVTHFEKADITELEELRKRYAPKAEAAGGKLTMTAILLKIVASALKLFPKFNASLDMAGQEIIYKHYYHVGIAVDTEHGLLVPVIRDVDRKNIVQLSLELTQVSEKARSRKVSLDDLEGGTFTITNLGGIGGTNFAPIINPPEVAILGVARASMEPVFKDGAFLPRLMLPLSLSYDHRLIDGADAARFMRWLAQAIEQPFLLSLEG
jgi:pyruvate dehydrogenase E2 component (dihydrolipoamide acetyltransferase)